jgi:hypothetical protein
MEGGAHHILKHSAIIPENENAGTKGISIQSSAHKEPMWGGNLPVPHPHRKVLQQLGRPRQTPAESGAISTESLVVSQAGLSNSNIIAIAAAVITAVGVIIALLVFLKGFPSWERWFPPAAKVSSRL